MTNNKILTLHPLGKNGKNIDSDAYDLFKEAIINSLQNKELTHDELMNYLNNKLKDNFSKNIGWYGETVKLDLEARKIIGRTSTKPQKYKLI